MNNQTVICIISKCNSISGSISSPHNTNYVVFFFLHNQAQAFDLSAMLGACSHDIDSCGVDAAMYRLCRQKQTVILSQVHLVFTGYCSFEYGCLVGGAGNQ